MVNIIAGKNKSLFIYQLIYHKFNYNFICIEKLIDCLLFLIRNILKAAELLS